MEDSQSFQEGNIKLFYIDSIPKETRKEGLWLRALAASIENWVQF